MIDYKETCEALRRQVSDLLFDIAVKNELIKGLIRHNERMNEELRRRNDETDTNAR